MSCGTYDPWGWSVTSFTFQNRTTIIFNPRHSAGRRSSDIAHELAHELLGHQPATMILSLELDHFCMRSFNQKQEDEANCLGWTLLLPREGLLRAKLKKKNGGGDRETIRSIRNLGHLPTSHDGNFPPSATLIVGA